MKEKVERHVLLRLIKALNDGEELTTVSKIVSADSNLTAKVLRFVNSAYSGLKRTITSVEDAVAFLGYKKLKELALSLLLTSFLYEKEKEELLEHLTFAYLTKFIARQELPAYADEAFMVGVLYPLYLEAGQELLEVLKEAGVASEVVEGLRDGASPLGRLRKTAQETLKECLRLARDEIEELPANKELTKACLEAYLEAEKIVELL